MSKIQFISVLILVAFLSFSIRLGEIYMGMKEINNSAFASAEAEETHEEPPPLHNESGTVDKLADPRDFVKDPDAEEPEEDADYYGDVDWRDSTESDVEYSGVNLEMFEDLSKRRQELDKWEKQLMAKEALLKAAEQEIDRKYKELETLRERLEALIGEQSEEENKRIDSLVKVYEGMKPDSAAQIFNTLDLDVLVQVLSRMSERKLSPILAKMDPDRAKTVTIILAQQKQLPTMPQ